MYSGARSFMAENARIRVKESKFMASNEHTAKDFILSYYLFLSIYGIMDATLNKHRRKIRIKKR
jgi:hypothetical protein